MEGQKCFAVVGGDARQAAAARALARAGYSVGGPEMIAVADYILLPLPLDAARTPLAELLRAAKPGAVALGGRLSAQAKQIAQDVLARAVSPKAPPKKPVNQLESSIWPKIVAGKAQKFAVSDACVACGQCARLCPRGNIRIEGGRAVIGGNCIQCLSCLQYCPQQAISIGRITDRREHYHNPNVTAAELTESVIHVD